LTRHTVHIKKRFFDFGPRWRCLKAIHVGTGEALAVLDLPAAFAGDTSEYHLHPALLDLVTGSAFYLVADYGPSSSVYFPMYYKSAVVYRRIPSRFFSHIRSRQKNEAGLDVATFELTLLDEQGSVLAQIDGFSMRQVRDPRDGLGIKGAHLSADAARDGFALELPQRGIVPAQGAKAFMRIIASQRSPEVFVLPDGQDVSSVIRKSPGGMILKRAC
jgi:Polyketide synthase dehydratase